MLPHGIAKDNHLSVTPSRKGGCSRVEDETSSNVGEVRRMWEKFGERDVGLAVSSMLAVAIPVGALRREPAAAGDPSSRNQGTAASGVNTYRHGLNRVEDLSDWTPRPPSLETPPPIWTSPAPPFGSGWDGRSFGVMILERNPLEIRQTSKYIPTAVIFRV